MCVYVYIVAMTKIAWCLWARGKWVAKIMILLLDLAPWASGWDMANGLRRSWSRDCEVSDIITFCKGVCAHTHILYTYIYIYISIYLYIFECNIYIHAIYTYHHTYYFLSNHQVGGAPAVAKSGFKETVTWDGFLYVTRPMPEVWRGFTWFQPFTVCQMSC